MVIGLDVGSTTIKCVVLDENGKIVFSSYERHFSQIASQTAALLEKIEKDFLKGAKARLMVSGSAGMGMADRCSLPFIQEVYATRIAAKRLVPDTDVIIELGGEDAKILYLTQGMEVRMNGSCAGGTGAFIDQMASLLQISVDELNTKASKAEKVYTVASRCGVFAKSDIQPLLNQGARKSDISASILQAVVNQTIGGLAQGRAIKGNIVYLGGPLTFLDQLRKAFDQTLKTEGLCPPNSLYYVALGAAYCATSEVDLRRAIEFLKNPTFEETISSRPPLFASEEEYSTFLKRHNKAAVNSVSLKEGEREVYLGIDAGSTTVKSVLINTKGEIVESSYESNSGNPIPLIHNILTKIYDKYPDIIIKGSAVTGYGEEIIKAAFSIDEGVVETVAHFTAAQHFMPEVEFVIDIGGQDIKCFQIHNGAIDNIFLNEACSSGCGSFLQTFAQALDYSIEDFAKLGLFASHPVDLGSRCTVFMNSAVKQAQKEGSTVEDISAGLSISVVKNALYKVIRAVTVESLGRHIVVQGGTFHNDAVLRAFEQELKTTVVRPTIAGLMGAYGAALHAKKHVKTPSTTITKEALESFEHKVRVTTCRLCTNHCRLTINTFSNKQRYISGNRCEQPITKKASDESLNIYDWKLRQIEALDCFLSDDKEANRKAIGIPLTLNMYELIYFWKAFFETLGKRVVISPLSNRDLYLEGQATIPSDTICFPAKLAHGHIQHLLDGGVEQIFYPCMTYNLDEGLGENHFNCPVVAYYPEVISANMEEIKRVEFINFHVGIHRPKDFPKLIGKNLEPYFGKLDLKLLQKAARRAYRAQEEYLKRTRQKGEEILLKARSEGKLSIVLAGRPYHADPEVSHGIDKLISSFGVAVLSEDALSHRVTKFPVNVLNQWTYHARLYAAAKAIAHEDDIHLVQLVSFGCGVDAITSDETRDILEREGKMYTQIKIDEITNLGAVKIRLRSLLSAIAQKGVANGK
ncbi:MAG: acyl-CoA dehydratase activase [Sphaerochaetaceae bacterium]|nr:acyl-CoA dehydratase activase [Sphaerochaetaceae bacterium]HHU88781.1 2-hydroxyglutaryl-CoA dehydratase [Spirochaetales bacterium]